MNLAYVDELAELELDGALWASTLFASRVRDWFSGPQLELWDFINRVRLGQGAVPFKGQLINAFIGIWGRGEAKTTNVEMAIANLAARRARHYGIVVSKTLQQANERITNIADLLTEPDFQGAYPEVGTRYVAKYGVGSWSSNHLTTASGFELRAFGLNSPVRGAQSRGRRPDLIVFDDLDEPYDSAYMTAKKVDTIRKSILPARAPGAVVVGVQNLILAGGIFDQLAHGADWLANRYVSGPHPAIQDVKYAHEVTPEGRRRARIIGGTPTWKRAGGYAPAQELLDDIGFEAFEVEAQHNLRAVSNRTYPQFSPERHAWRKVRLIDGRFLPDLPEFDLFIGGIDYGGEGEGGHLSAIGVAGYVRSADTLILLWTWGENGAGVDERQRQAMYEFSNRAAAMKGITDPRRAQRLIYWRAGADQYRENGRLRQEGFRVNDSDREGPVRAQRERWMGDRLGMEVPDALGQVPKPRMYYIEDSEVWPDACSLWAGEMTRMRKKQPRYEDEPVKRETISVNDDRVQAVEYIAEEVELVHRRGTTTWAKAVEA